jgi:hypothetical protein
MNEIIEINRISYNNKLFNIFENILQNIKTREIFSPSGLINTVKNGFNGVMGILNERLNAQSANPDLELLKL